VATGPGGTVAGGSRWGAAATRFPTDFGLAHYSTAALGTFGHPTAYWSHSYVTARAGYVRAGFYHYGAFYPGWYGAHPLAWAGAGWAAGAAWTAATWPSLATFINVSAVPINYDYGNTIVYQANTVYNNGEDVGTAQQYTQQASTLAAQGQQAQPPPSDKWQPLGVFALVQGDETTSNTLLQLAVNQEGIIRGNYFDALMNSSSTVFGAVDKKTEQAAWTIGDKKEPVFEAGIFNLTKDETPVLVHFGPDKTQQWLLVRIEHKDSQTSPGTEPATSVPARDASTALVTVLVPASASVLFDGAPTTQTGTQRVYVTPPLPSGQEFSYKIEARWTAADGTPVNRTRTVQVAAGANARVDFSRPQP
jgi:uncharacterized protein (TIGR03000 family)